MTDVENEINFQELRKIIIETSKAEREGRSQTQLRINENPNRRLVTKLNPKFCADWDNLELDWKLNRIIEYTSRYGNKHDLPGSTVKKIRKLLASALKNDTLKQVVYDSTLGIITDIPKLLFSKEDGYYLGTYLDDNGSFISRVSKITKYSSGGGEPSSITTEHFQNKKKASASASSDDKIKLQISKK